MRPFSSGGTYVNFLTEDADEERLRAAYGADLYARLARIKAKYDPDNLIRSNEPEHPARARRLSRRALGNRSYRVARRCYAETARPRPEKACGRPLPHRLCLRAPVDIGRRFLIS